MTTPVAHKKGDFPWMIALVTVSMIAIVLFGNFMYQSFKTTSDTAGSCEAKNGKCKPVCAAGEANVGSGFCADDESKQCKDGVCTCCVKL